MIDKIAVDVNDIKIDSVKTVYPEKFAKRVDGRQKRRLGDAFGLKNFGINMTTLAPGSQSALLHRHALQDEFIYIIEGTPTLIMESEELQLKPGMCAGFPAKGEAHHLVNNSNAPVVYFEIGDRTKGDEVVYPNDDLTADMNDQGKWVFSKKDGTLY